MEKEDLVIEFHNLINKIENVMFTERTNRNEHLNNNYPDFDFESEIVSIPFIHEFYLNGYKCKINLRGTLEIID